VFTFLALLELLQNKSLLIFMGEGYNNFVLSTPEAAPEGSEEPNEENSEDAS
jgi:hypothetical protein